MKSESKKNYDFWTYFFVVFLIIFIVYFIIILFQSNVIDDGTGILGASATAQNYTDPRYAKKLDVTKQIHVLTAPTVNNTYSNFYLPPGKNNGDSITFLHNYKAGAIQPNIQIWVDNTKTNVGIQSNLPWYPFALTYTSGSATNNNAGSIARAVWYNNYWFVSNNNVQLNS